MNDTLKDLKGTPGAEPQEVVELRLTECKLRWQRGACQADGGEPCYNVIESCQDEANFSPAGRAVRFTRVDDGSGNFSFSDEALLNEVLSVGADGGDAVTVEFWIRQTDEETFSVSLGDGSDYHIYVLMRNGEDPPAVEVIFNGYSSGSLTTGVTVFDEPQSEKKDRHVAVTTGVGVRPYIRLMIDGEVVGETYLGQDADSLSVDRVQVSSTGSASSIDHAYLQLLRVWKRDLLPNRIDRDKARHLPTSTIGLVGQWSGTRVENNELLPDRGTAAKFTGDPVYSVDSSWSSRPSMVDEDPLRIRVSRDDRPLPDGLDATPVLKESSVAEAKIEVGELGARGSATARMGGHVDDDRALDPYRDDPARISSFDGTFWARFRARHRYYHQREMVNYTGYTPVRTAYYARLDGAKSFNLPVAYPFDPGAGERLGVDLYVRVDELTAVQRIVGTDAWRVDVLTDGSVRAEQDGSGGTDTATTAAGAVMDRRWTRVSVVFGPSLKIYINALEVANVTGTGTAISPAEKITFGATPAGGSNLTGELADVALFTDDFTEDFLALFELFRADEAPGLLAYLPFYDQALTDFSGNGLHGTGADLAYFEDRREWTHPAIHTEEFLEGMTPHLYVLENMSGPDDNDEVEFQAKDPITFLEKEKAQYPKLSRGALSADLAESAGPGSTFDASLPQNVTADEEYPSGQQTVRIGDEHILATRNSGSATFTIDERAVDNTEIAGHDQDDAIQAVVKPSGPFDDLIMDFFTRAGCPSRFLTPDAYRDEILNNTNDLIYKSIISEPTPIKKLLGELITAAGVDLWWDDRLAQFRIRAQKSPPEDIPTVDFDRQVYADSVEMEDSDEDIITQVWVFYNQLDPTEDVDKLTNYRAAIAIPRPLAEEEARLGTSRIKNIPTRWISNRPAAADLGDRLLRRLGGLPFKMRADLDYLDIGELWTGSVFNLLYRNHTDLSGAPVQQPMQIVGAKEKDPGNRYQVRIVNYDYETEPDDLTNEVEIDVNEYNVNLRERHDSEHNSVNDNTVIRILAGVIVGSTSTGAVAVDMGDWSDVDTNLRLEIVGRVQGAGGISGAGGDVTSALDQVDGENGQDGGDAIKVTGPITIDNQGEIWAGGGGSGGGGAGYIYKYYSSSDFGPSGTIVEESNGGGGGGGAAGSDPSAGGAGGAANIIDGSANQEHSEKGEDGSPGGSDSGGSAGAGGDALTYENYETSYGGDGGDGVGPGQDGNPGQPGFATNNEPGGDNIQQRAEGAAGAGGTAGNYIVGNQHVSWESTGDRRGNVA